MSDLEYACVFTRPPRARLVAAERLVHALPSYLPGVEGECDLFHQASPACLAAVLRAPAEAFTAGILARLGFWTARTGGRGVVVGALPAAEAERLRRELGLCHRVVRGTPIARLPGVAADFLAGVEGLPPGPREVAAPVLGIDLLGGGTAGLHYRPERRALFVPAGLAPPRGDQLTVVVRAGTVSVPAEGWATVVEVRTREEARPGEPAGFTLRIEGPTALHDLLARRVPAPSADEVRGAPRYPVAAPVTLTPLPHGAGGALPALDRPSPPRARLEYATDQELAADWIENLSQGGAFVRTPAPLPRGTELLLDLALPDGTRLEARAVVVFVNERGMGTEFALSPEADELLAATITRITARPRRALVVDDDALVRAMISDALSARGFEVMTADCGESGLRTLAEELLGLDLLVTDVCMPGMDGEEFVRTIRGVGGEADLAIVVASGRLGPGTEERLEAAGADAVLDKALGPELVAQAADAALERKRLVGRADAA